MIIVRLLSPEPVGWLSTTNFTRVWEPTLLWNQLRGSGFPASLCDRRCRTGHGFASRRFAQRQNLGVRRSSPLDPSDDRSVERARYGQGHEPVLAPQTINQSKFPRAQHLLRQREKIPERPNQIYALHKIRFYVSRPDRRVQFKYAAGEFFNPHDLVHLGKDGQLSLYFQSGLLLHHRRGNGKQSFYFHEQTIGLAWINLRKGKPGERLPGELGFPKT